MRLSFLEVGDSVTNRDGETQTVANVGSDVVTFTDGRGMSIEEAEELVLHGLDCGEPGHDYTDHLIEVPLPA